MNLPRAAYPFVEFPAILRSHGFAVAPDQTMGFIHAIGLLGPYSLDDIHAAGLAMLAIPPERRAEYSALFRAYFLGDAAVSALPGSDEEDAVDVHEPTGRSQDTEMEDADDDTGSRAERQERLSHRQFDSTEEVAALRAFAKQAPTRLPRRLSYRRTGAKTGDRLDMRKALRQAVRRDGEVFTLPRTRRKTRQRRVLLLIDVSGSMKDRTEALLRFAHTLAQSAERFEAFTLGTRLTRISSALKLRQVDDALLKTGGTVADFDGGTRIGDALTAFLNVPRYAGFARGAAVLVLSDGLERGDPAAMIAAVQKLSRMAWRIDWLTPLAADADYMPRTEALHSVLPWLDALADGSRTASIAAHVLNMSRSA